ncbi:MAG: hypothetical protein JO208_15555 [Alphaproteobacteria bacterium]|nr:hypothetical protein [Alphaproteobacteria bacterium]
MSGKASRSRFWISGASPLPWYDKLNAMSTLLRQREEELFAEWRTSWPEHEQSAFVTDGAVCPDEYENCSLKILLLLKEVNDPNGGGWCLREFLSEGGRSQTWNVVTRWLRSIRNPEATKQWKDIRVVTKGQRVRELQSVAAMNLKKYPGGHTSVGRTWREMVIRDREYVRRQFELYDADLVICCGSDVAGALKHTALPQDDWAPTTRGVDYLEYKPGKFVIGYSHPEARVAENLLHYGLVDAVHEILQR